MSAIKIDNLKKILEIIFDAGANREISAKATELCELVNSADFDAPESRTAREIRLRNNGEIFPGASKKEIENFQLTSGETIIGKRMHLRPASLLFYTIDGVREVEVSKLPDQMRRECVGDLHVMFEQWCEATARLAGLTKEQVTESMEENQGPASAAIEIMTASADALERLQAENEALKIAGFASEALARELKGNTEGLTRDLTRLRDTMELLREKIADNKALQAKIDDLKERLRNTESR